jgi:cyclomaltodextrinase / maltogenic alpha-amylase / neopullulanase
MNVNKLLLLILLLWSIFTPSRAASIPDLIPPVKVSAGIPDTVLVSDLFYAKSYDLSFTSNNAVAVTYDRKTNRVVFAPKPKFAGSSLVKFTLGGVRYALPVIVQAPARSQQLYTFKYVPGTNAANVFVTGSFNNWSKDRNRLLDAKGTGVFEAAVQLDPGSYIYKFIVDGKEILDPANPEKTPTGFDDFNSVVRIADPDSATMFLHVGRRAATKSGTVFSFLYENSVQSSTLQTAEIVALLDNGSIERGQMRISGNVLEIPLTTRALKGDRTLRVMISQNGKTTNLQQIVLQDGIPVGLKPGFRAWDDGVIYSIMIDRFNDGDKTNDIPVVHDSIFTQANYQGGDFKGITQKIDDGYFDSLGVNILWISPVNDNPDIAFREYPAPHRWYSGYHGYWPISENKVEEKFGSMEDLKDLIARAHRHGMRVLLDFVAHHVHIDHPFYKEHPDWFGTLDLPDGRKNLRLWDEFRLTTWFEPYMPSFDYTKSKAALDAMSDNAVWWLTETGADGFRHDAVKHVPNVFWRTLTQKLKERIELPTHKKVYQIGETFGDYDLIASYVNNGQLSAQFNFNLSYFAIPVFLESDRSFVSIDYHMKKSFSSFGYNHVMGNIMDSHDKVRYMAYADGKVKNQGVDTREMAWNNPPTVDHPSSYLKAELYYAYMFTIPGLPIIDYGSEFGMTGADDPDNRRFMRFGEQLSIYEKQMLTETQNMVKMRNAHSALRYGDFYTLVADTAVYAYLRSDMNERLLVVLNKSLDGKTVEVKLPAAISSEELVDVINGSAIRVVDHRAVVAVPAIGWRVLKVQ